MFELRGVGVYFNPFSSNLISVIFNVHFDKLTICISGFVFAMDFCMEFVLGIKNDPYLSLDCIPCFDNIYLVAYTYSCNLYLAGCSVNHVSESNFAYCL